MVFTTKMRLHGFATLFVFMKSVGKMLLFAGTIFVVLRYFGSFSEKQSIILAFILWAIFESFTEVRKAARNEFEPYSIWIEPKWRDLLRDYKLMKDDEWDSLTSRLKQTPESQYHVLRTGFRFTVLKPQPFESLIYRDDRKYFRGEIDFRERIEEIELQMPETNVSFSPTVFVKWGKNGYDIGITTPESLRRSYHPRDNRELVVIATLPYETFSVYTHQRLGFSTVQTIEKARKAALQEHGWKLDELDSEFPDWGENIEHKYFYVSLNGI